MKSSFLYRLPTLAVAIALVHPNAFSQEANKNLRRSPQPEVRYPLGEDSLPQADVPKGKLEGPFLHHSEVIADTVRKYWVWVPAQYSSEEPSAVLVFQDGARAINPSGVLRVPQVLENLIAKKQIPVTIGIFITPGQRGDEFPDSIGTGNPNNRDREYDVLNDAYARMLLDEILPEVGERYALSKDPRERAIGGASSGAICAFTVAWERPQEFQNVISLIGSFTDIHGGHIYPDLVRKNEKKPIRIFLQDGVNDLRNTQDPNRDWHLQNQKMVAALEEKGYDMAHVFGSGGHSDDHGGAMLPEMLRWIWRDHPDVKPTEIDLIAKAEAIQPEIVDPFPGFSANATVDPAGTYHWENRFGNMRIESSLTISRNDAGEISGTFRSKRGDQDEIKTPIESPELIGNKLIFDVTTVFRDRELTTTYHGILADNKIQGWRVMEFGGHQRDMRWTAEKE